MALITQAAFPIGPPQPGNLNASVYSTTAAEIFWQRSEDDGVVGGYEIRRNDSLIDMNEALSYFDSSLTPATAYNYTVIAVDNEGNK